MRSNERRGKLHSQGEKYIWASSFYGSCVREGVKLSEIAAAGLRNFVGTNRTEPSCLVSFVSLQENKTIAFVLPLTRGLLSCLTTSSLDKFSQASNRLITKNRIMKRFTYNILSTTAMWSVRIVFSTKKRWGELSQSVDSFSSLGWKTTFVGSKSGRAGIFWHVHTILLQLRAHFISI